MKAVSVHPSARQVKLIDVEEPVLAGPRNVKVQIRDVGVCGTDREICRFDYGTPPDGSPYLVIGHEAFGRVVEVGDAATGVRVGDYVVPMVRRPCWHDTCTACRSERQDFCYTGDFVERGIKEAHGFMTEYVVDEDAFFVPVPAALRDVAVLVEPLTIAQKALAQVGRVQARLPWACPTRRGSGGHTCHRAVVLGAGPVGLLGALALVNAGFETWVYSRSAPQNPRAALVESFGARYVPAETTTPDELAKEVGNIDLVYEAVGASRVAFDVLLNLGTNGVFIFTGVPGRKAPVEVDTDLLMRRLVLENQVVFGTVNAGRETFEDAIRDLESYMARWPDSVRALISGRYPVEDYESLLLGGARGVKDVIAFAR